MTKQADLEHPLHVTNGDATVPGLRGAGLDGTIMPWRDVLHEGPVPDVPDDELRRIRSAFLERRDAGDIGTASRSSASASTWASRTSADSAS